MNILRSFQQKALLRQETIHVFFFAWLSTLLQDSKWRDYVRRKLEESELPVIEFAGRKRRSAPPPKRCR